MKKYNLIITERQAKRIILALDLYTRLFTGQLNELKNLTSNKINEKTLELLQKQMFPSLSGLNSSHGIHSRELPDEIREAYDIFKVLMYEFNKDQGISNVYSDKVRQTSKQVLPKFEKLEKNENQIDCKEVMK